jgi:hypothetical protein
MVETRERDVVYTTDSETGPSTALIVLFSLLIVAVLGFMVYFFSNSDLRNNPQTIIERNTNTTVPMPIPTPSAPSAPDINITPPSTPATPAPSSNNGTTTP